MYTEYGGTGILFQIFKCQWEHQFVLFLFWGMLQCQENSSQCIRVLMCLSFFFSMCVCLALFLSLPMCAFARWMCSSPVNTKTKPLFCSAQIVPDLWSQRNSKTQKPNISGPVFLSDALQIWMDVQKKNMVSMIHIWKQWWREAYFESLWLNQTM